MIFMSKFPLFSPNFKLGFKEAGTIFQFLVRSREIQKGGLATTLSPYIQNQR